jgi:membrane associated rhomboid family serine protease
MTYRGRGSSTAATWSLIAINLLVFMVTTIVNHNNPNYMYYNFGLARATFLDKPWTLLTSMFIHASIWHILANMITFYFFGSYLNRLLGAWKFLVIYFAGGIAGGLVYLLLAPSNVIAVGASGAIFTLGGVLAVMRPKLRVIVFPIPVPLPLWIAIIGIFVVVSFIPNVAWQAHLGGLALGLVAGYFFRRQERRQYY